MKIIGAIMEINPFHNGHIYFLENIPKKKEDILIVITSTTLTQRGEFSVLPKDIKTQLLLDNNVDIVLELPSVLANQGGLHFAKHAIDALYQFNITDLYFGSESNDLDKLIEIVKKDFNQKDFKNGIYKDELNELKSNDILGISYLKAIKDKDIKPHLIKRINNDYNDTNISNNISSATSIRENINNKQLIKNSLPAISLENILEINHSILYVLFKNNLSYVLQNNINIKLSENNQILYKLNKNINNCYSIDELIKISKDKNNSSHKLRRIITNTILLIIENDYKNEYLRVLGFNSKGQQYLKSYKGQYITTLKNNNSNNAIIEIRALELLSSISKTKIKYNDFQKPCIKE